MKGLWQKLRKLWQGEHFLETIESLEATVARILSLAMIVVIAVATIDLMRILLTDLAKEPRGFFSQSLFEIFGAFLNILIALEILENITAYLRKHVIQVELVIATSLVAVARKIIILDLNKTTGITIIGLGASVLALAISYWLIRKSNQQKP